MCVLDLKCWLSIGWGGGGGLSLYVVPSCTCTVKPFST